MTLPPHSILLADRDCPRLAARVAHAKRVLCRLATGRVNTRETLGRQATIARTFDMPFGSNAEPKGAARG